MVTVGLLVRLEAKPGKEEEVNAFIAGALPLAQQEAGTTAWFALRLGPSTSGSLTYFRMRAGETRIWADPSPRR